MRMALPSEIVPLIGNPDHALKYLVCLRIVAESRGLLLQCPDLNLKGVQSKSPVLRRLGKTVYPCEPSLLHRVVGYAGPGAQAGRFLPSSLTLSSTASNRSTASRIRSRHSDWHRRRLGM